MYNKEESVFIDKSVVYTECANVPPALTDASNGYDVTFVLKSDWLALCCTHRPADSRSARHGCEAVAYPGGGSGCSNTPLSVHFINYSLQSVNVGLAA